MAADVTTKLPSHPYIYLLGTEKKEKEKGISFKIKDHLAFGEWVGFEKVEMGPTIAGRKVLGTETT